MSTGEQGGDGGAGLDPARRVRQHVLEILDDRRDRGRHVSILRSWCEGPAVCCFVYESVFGEGVLGLRIEVDPLVPVELSARDIVDGDMGEPLGAYGHTLSGPDERGVRWWGGDEPSIRMHARVEPPGRPGR